MFLINTKNSMEAIITNDTHASLRLVSNGRQITLASRESTSSVIGAAIHVHARKPVIIRGPRMQMLQSPFTPSLAGQYAIMTIGGEDVRLIVDRILAMDCPPSFGHRPYEAPPCEYMKYNEIMGMLRNMDKNNINDVVQTMVPGQGFQPITLLEASLLMRNVPVISWLLANGASPNITSTGIPLTQQLCPPGQEEDATMALIAQMLVSAGAPPVLASPYVNDRYNYLLRQMLPELWRESITFLHGEDAINACNALTSIEAYNCRNDDHLWNEMLDRDYPGLDGIFIDMTPYQVYHMLSEIDSLLGGYGLIFESSVLDHPVEEMLYQAEMEGRLRRLVHDSEAEACSMSMRLKRVPEDDVDIMRDIYMVLYDTYLSMLDDTIPVKEANSIINHMIAEGSDAYDPDGEYMMYESTDFRYGNDQGSHYGEYDSFDLRWLKSFGESYLC